MDYNGYSISVSTFADDGLRATFHATYMICRGDRMTASGTVAGDLKTIADAERAGYRAARQWIERQPETTAEARRSSLGLGFLQPLHSPVEHCDKLANLVGLEAHMVLRGNPAQTVRDLQNDVNDRAGFADHRAQDSAQSP